MEKIIYTDKEINYSVNKILNAVSTRGVVCFDGPMGAGKTTLVKALVRRLGGSETVSSPTFGIVNEYHYPDGRLLGYHFDFYRLNDPSEALDLGLEDYLNQDAWIFVEWPEKVKSLLPEERTDLVLEILDPVTRQLTIRDKTL